MASATPHVHDHVLTYHYEMQEVTIILESSSWWSWLNKAETTTFRVTSPQGRYTARREKKRGKWYWSAYRKRQGKLVKVYLGKSEELTKQRLLDVARTITERTHFISKISLLDSPSRYEQTNELLLLDTPREKSLFQQPFAQGFFEEEHNLFFALKLVPPSLRPSLVARPRLIEAVATAMQRTLTIICASAGSGKSTLLSTWYTSSSPISKLWLSLDEEDNDPLRFWMALVSALQRRFPGIGHHALVWLCSPQPPVLKTILASLLADIRTLSEPLVIVLDDYQVIKTQETHQSFAFFLDHVPPQMHVLLATRTTLPFSIARLRARGQCSEIQMQDLLFTLEEATAFFQQVMALSLSKEEIAELIKRTEGWIVGMQLAALSLQGHENSAQFITTFAGNHDYIVEYLAEEVLNRQPTHIQHFLLVTSLLDRFTAPLCDAVLGQNESYRTLRFLEQANLFTIPLDEQRQWYRYHHLFAEFLRNHASFLPPDQITAFHSRSAQWYEHNGFIDEAANHLFATSNFHEILPFLLRHCEPYLKRSQIATLLRWMQALPDTILRSHPSLSLYYAAALCATDHFDAAEQHIHDAEQVLQEREHHPSETSTSLQGLRIGIMITRIAVASFRGDIKQTLDLFHQIQESLAGGNAYWTIYFQCVLMTSIGTAYVLNGNFAQADTSLREAEMLGTTANYHELVLISTSIRAYMVMDQGYFRQAAARYRQILQYALEEGWQRAVDMAYLGIGELHYYGNELDSAEHSLRCGIDLGRRGGNIFSLTRGVQFLARVKQARGDRKGAFEIVNQLEQHALRFSTFPIMMRYIDALRADLWLRQGNMVAASHWAQNSGLHVYDMLSYQDEFIYLSFAHTISLIDRQDEAETLLNRLLDLSEAEGRMRSTLDILVHQAALFQKLGRRKQAQATLLRALSYAEPEGVVRIFIDAGESVQEILGGILATQTKTTRVSPPSFAFISALINTQNQLNDAMLSSIGTPLTAREREVLHFLMLGLSNRQIASELVIAVSTVKWYLRQIYTKLHVENRMQVAARARELHLL